MLSVLNIAGDFKEIRASVEMSAKSWETVSNRPSFYVYNHRGKAFSPFYEESISTGRRSLMDIPERFLSWINDVEAHSVLIFKKSENS